MLGHADMQCVPHRAQFYVTTYLVVVARAVVWNPGVHTKHSFCLGRRELRKPNEPQNAVDSLQPSVRAVALLRPSCSHEQTKHGIVHAKRRAR